MTLISAETLFIRQEACPLLIIRELRNNHRIQISSITHGRKWKEH
jgi:hypothetical protein